MPIYEYRCERCKQRFERLVSLREANAAPTCPQCGATETRKQFSPFASMERNTSSNTSTCVPSGG